MKAGLENFGLTNDECDIAGELWDALMFAPTSLELDSARLALMKVSYSIQHAVISNINANWLKEYEPSREENPFLLHLPLEAKCVASEAEKELLSPQVELYEMSTPTSIPTLFPLIHIKQ